MFTGIQGRISILQGYMTRSANCISYSVAQCSLSWLHIIHRLPVPNSTKLRVTHLSATSPEQFHNTQDIYRLKIPTAHGMTRLTACRRLCLCSLKHCMLPAPEVLGLDSTGLCWASFFWQKHTGFWGIHLIPSTPSSVKYSFAQLHWSVAKKKHPAGSTAENMKCRVLSRAAVKINHCEGTRSIHGLAKSFTQTNDVFGGWSC